MPLPNKSIFGYDPLIGCPFDDSEMEMVESSNGFSMDDEVEFQDGGLWVKGIIVGIGQNAKYLNGGTFTAIAVRVGDHVHSKTQRHLRHRVL